MFFSESLSHSNEQKNEFSFLTEDKYNDVAVGTNSMKTKSIRTQYKDTVVNLVENRISKKRCCQATHPTFQKKHCRNQRILWK